MATAQCQDVPLRPLSGFWLEEINFPCLLGERIERGANSISESQSGRKPISGQRKPFRHTDTQKANERFRTTTDRQTHARNHSTHKADDETLPLSLPVIFLLAHPVASGVTNIPAHHHWPQSIKPPPLIAKNVILIM